MLVNFALDVLGTKITSDKVSTDGHECTNLVSANWHQRRKGFLAEHFIKPPVNITLEFPCAVCIQHVLVTPCVGQQQSSQLELYAASRPGRQTSADPKTQQNRKQNADADSLPVFYPISRISVPDNSRICFYNPKFGQLSGRSATDVHSSYQHKAVMRHFRTEIIAACTHLTLRIVRTQNGSTAAVSSIDVWGFPAKSALSVIKDDIVNKYIHFMRPNSSVQNKEQTRVKNPDNEESSVSTKQEAQDQPELDIPEEFIDPLTCEVMAVPMLLPCGKNVDQSTLEHFFSVEASHGRQPRDPFTGVEFSSSSRPLPNGALKARIDQFLIKHSDNKATLSIARTVGVGKPVSHLGKRKASGVSSLISQKSANGTLEDSTPLQGCHSSKVKVHNYGEKAKHMKPHVQAELTSATKQPNVSHELCIMGQESLGSVGNVQISNSISSTICNGATNSKSHESQLKNSLNEALSSIFGCLPSCSTVNSSIQDTTTHRTICSLCREALDIEKPSYVTPCQHCVCRSCLTANPKISGDVFMCGTCNKEFQRSDVIRRHIV